MNETTEITSILPFIESINPILLALVILLVFLTFNFFIKKLLSRIQYKYKQQNQGWKYSFYSTLEKPLTYFIWFSAAIIFLNILFLGLFKHSMPYMEIILSVGAVLTLGWFLVRWNSSISNYLRELSHKGEIGLTPHHLDLLHKLAIIGIVLLTLFLLMDVTGRSFQTLIALGGIGGIALAFASQQFIANFFGGLMIYLTQPFVIGEKLVLPEKKIEGDVEEIGWYTTCIIDSEKKPIYIPNSLFNQSIVINPSRISYEKIHVLLTLRHDDLDKLESILQSIKIMLQSNHYIDHKTKPDTFLSNISSLGLEIDISTYVLMPIPIKIELIREEILMNIARIIKEKGAQIAPEPIYPKI